MDLFAVPVARCYRTPVVLSSQRAHRGLTPGVTRHLLRMTDRMVDGIVVNSRAVARELAEEDGVPASMVRLGYNGLDTGVFRRGGVRGALPVRVGGGGGWAGWCVRAGGGVEPVGVSVRRVQ